jgi:CheY-like chemotaxis protein
MAVGPGVRHGLVQARVLVVDDHDANRRFLCGRLEAWQMRALVLLCHVFANRFQLADNQRHAVGCQAMATKYPTV